MKKLAIVVASLLILRSSKGQEYLSFYESDPNKMGWMKGFPPKDDSILSAIDGSFFEFPALRYSVCHMRQFFPSTEVQSAENSRYNLEIALDKGLDNVEFTPMGSNEKMTFQESLAKVYTDGIIVLHKGKIVYERYFGELKPNGVHTVMSVSKTFTGTLGALLIAEGILDEEKTAAEYVPELGKSAFGDATIRQILDMTTALQYSEDYADPNADIWIFSAAGNPFPKPPGYAGPKNYYQYLQTVKKTGMHGEYFGYKTINTDAIGWIISRVTGKSIPKLLSERIWKPLGTHFDGYYLVDGAGIAFAGGGLTANLRDLAMFGEMIRNNGFFNGKQVIPSKVIEDIRVGGSQKAFEKAGYVNLKNWSYRNMWWITHNENGAFSARGVHGQAIYIDPTAQMVLVRLASHPVAGNQANDPYSLPAYDALAKYFVSKK